MSRAPKTHILKTWPAPFAASKAGLKPWEYRVDDRDYQVGDTLDLREWDPATLKDTGEALLRTVAFILRGGQFGIPAGYCVMSCPEQHPDDIAAAVGEAQEVARRATLLAEAQTNAVSALQGEAVALRNEISALKGQAIAARHAGPDNA